MQQYAPEILYGVEDYQEAWVVFSGETDVRWLKILKPGFRHCFVLLNDRQCWMSVDPLSPYTDIQTYHHIETSFDLPQWLEIRGYQVVKTNINKQHNKPAPWMVFTCVESIKRILGLHKRFIFTPWQLYQYLKKDNQSETIKGDISWAA